jgi:glutamine amidotransferase
MIAIVNYGMGNLGSISNMLGRLGRPNVITSDPQVIADADSIILPGVGAFDRGMRNLAERNLVEPLTDLVQEKKVPVLGICLGMQLLARRSEEGGLPGLGWVDADAVRFTVPGVRVPHMGWNAVRVAPAGERLFSSADEERFYFVHSYYLCCDDDAEVAAWAHHGIDFPAAVVQGNVMGVQFHPEKSHRFGMALLERFATVATHCAD